MLLFFESRSAAEFFEGPSFRGDFRKGPLSSFIIQAYQYLRVPSQSSFKRLLLGTGLYLSSKMSVPLKSPEGLRDSECEKGNLGIRPPIPYVPPTDLLPVKEKHETLKIKVLDGTSTAMKIFSVGSPEDYLGHIMAVLSLIDRKGLRDQLLKHVNEKKNAEATLAALQQKPIGPKDKSSKKDQGEPENSDEVERKQTKEILKTAKTQYVEVIATTYEVVRSLLAGEPFTQWDRIVQEMHESDSWAGPDGKENTRSRASKGLESLSRLCGAT